MNIIQVSNLTKVYKSSFNRHNVTALKDFNLEVKEGQIYGLLGPNGAGKTTLVKILLGITFPTEGTAKMFNEDIANYKVKKYVGYLPENHRFPAYLTGNDVMKYFAKLSGYESKDLDKKIDALLKLVKMDQWKKVKVKKYSKGMMQRLGLAQAMLSDPKLIFLDEPTDGVDPVGRKEIRDILVRLKEKGVTIFLNSHLLSEVEMISDRVAILHKGVLLQEGSVEELTTTREVFKIALEEQIPEDILYGQFNEFNLKGVEANTYSASVQDISKLNELIDKLRQNKLLIKSVMPQKNTLEDMFISLINESEKK